MFEYIELGGTPYDEDCVQVSKTENYIPEMKEECLKYKNMLIEIFPQALKYHCNFGVKSFSHEFGCYYEVAIRYNDANDESSSFAWWVQDNLPAKWDDMAIRNFNYIAEEDEDETEDMVEE